MKIKEEKLDPEIECQLNSTTRPDHSEPGDNCIPQNEDKRNIEPLKSSNEILTELFNVFNAKPPENIIDNTFVKKIKKEHKKSKHKKSKKHKHKAPEYSSDSDEDSLSPSHSNKKRHKKKKHKHKKSKDSDDEKEMLELTSIERALIKSDIENQTRIEKDSDTTLSDEETYLREKKECSNTSKTPETEKRSDNFGKKNKFYRSSSGYFSDGRRNISLNREYRRHRSRSRTRSRSRSRSSSRDLKIDKKRLLEIARKNALLRHQGDPLAPGYMMINDDMKDNQLMKMRYGGKTLEDLTNFCKKLTNTEQIDDLSDISSGEVSDTDKQQGNPFIHHPFMVKDREPIVMHFNNPISTSLGKISEQKSMNLRFPVSSGQQHRINEVWIPVSPKPCVTPALPPSTSNSPQAMTSFNKNIFEKQLPEEEQQPAFKPIDSSTIGCNGDKNGFVSQPPMASLDVTIPPPTAVPPRLTSMPPIPKPISCSPVAPKWDVSVIVEQRLNAMRRLTENPGDSEAIKMIRDFQIDMRSWAAAENIKRNGVRNNIVRQNVMQASEVSEINGGMGMALLKKMGWKPGEGLGRMKTGSLHPLVLGPKLDKRGLVSNEEIAKHGSSNTNSQQSLVDKHPVCLLNELSTKRKWSPPVYELVTDEGPSHNKIFVFSVNVNGKVYNSGTGGNTKKQAKMLAAKHCLQQLGILS